MPFSVGPMELAIVLAIALIVLGPKRLPEAGRAIGKGMREFKDSIGGRPHDEHEAAERAVAAGTAPPAPAAPTTP